ncbi:hypothetical protein, partial [Bartonella sp. CL63NXGY]|uniref:hypothetical protein n=1 Tax=Bartonella sp. CL63NXGY TaxID=3243538 RepID=UPI0035CF8715
MSKDDVQTDLQVISNMLDYKANNMANQVSHLCKALKATNQTGWVDNTIINAIQASVKVYARSVRSDFLQMG